MNATRQIASFIIALCITTLTAHAETRVSGNLNGHWTRDGSPYIATDQITLPDSQSLIIDAGVEVRFEGDFPFFVYGQLRAVGAEGDSIILAPIAGGEAWGGLRLLSADSATVLDYCVFMNGHALHGEGDIDTVGSGGDIFIYSGDVRIDHSRISLGQARAAGAGIAIWNASPSISNSLINENQCLGAGGSLAIAFGSSPNIENTQIVGNLAVNSGGGAWIYSHSNPSFSNCSFASNHTTADAGTGGAVQILESSSPTFMHCDFTENASGAGGALYSRGPGTNTQVEWCYFWGNAANVGSRVGGAIYARAGSGLVLHYCRLVENNADVGGALYVKEPPAISVNHCLFLRNGATTAGGAIGTSTDLGDTPVTLTNCTFVNNAHIGLGDSAGTAYARPPSGQNPGAHISINSSIVMGAAPLFGATGRVLVTYSNVIPPLDGEGNSGADPGFFSGDSVWFLLSGGSPCIDSGDSTLALDPDSSRNDRGWMHLPHNAFAGLPDENNPLFAEMTTIDRASLPFRYRNNTGVPIYVTPMDRWQEGEREIFVDVSELTNDSLIHGVAWADSQFYLCGAANNQGSAQIYRLDTNYHITGQFNQPGIHGNQGYLDMASDGHSVLYGVSDDIIVEFATDGEFGQEFHAPNQVRNCRAIGADFHHPRNFVDFYLGGDGGNLVQADAEMFASQSIALGDTIVGIGTKDNERAVYALTQPDSAHAILWLITPDDQRVWQLYTISIPQGYQLGGMEATQTFRDGHGSLIGIMEGSNGNPDRLYALDLYTSWIIVHPDSRLLMPGEETEWPIILAGDQMPAGLYHGNFSFTVNGYGEGGEVAAGMQNNQSSVSKDKLVPHGFLLGQAYPNPFNSRARISLQVGQGGLYSLILTDVTGRLVQRLESGWLPAGNHQLSLDASLLPAGKYFIRLQAPMGTAVRPVTVLK